MKHSSDSRNFLTVVLLALFLAVIIPATALGQGRGRGYGRGGIFGSGHNKCGKFVNCHDARNGRWDGRGPRADRVGNRVLRNRIRVRNPGFNNGDLVLRNLRRRHRTVIMNDFARDRRFRDRNRDFDFDNDRDFSRRARDRRRNP